MKPRFILLFVGWLPALVIGADLGQRQASADEANGEKVYQAALKWTVWLGSGEGLGAGTLIDRKKGHVLTSYHAAGENDNIMVMFPAVVKNKLIAESKFYIEMLKQKKLYLKAKVISRDRLLDLAVVEILPEERQKIPKFARPIRFADGNPKAGEYVHSVGHGFPGAGSFWIYSQGQVRGVYDKSWSYNDGKHLQKHEAEIIETTSPIIGGDFWGGDWGGPLMNDQGELVGVTHGTKALGVQYSYFISGEVVKTFLKREKLLPPPVSPLPELADKKTEREGQDAGSKLYGESLKWVVWIVGHNDKGGGWTGTGFVIDLKKGRILTNHHMVGEEDKVEVYFPAYQNGKLLRDKKYYKDLENQGAGLAAKVIAKERTCDLAVIQFLPEALPKIPADVKAVAFCPNDPKPGESVHLTGNRGSILGRSTDVLWTYTPGHVRSVFMMNLAYAAGKGKPGIANEAEVVETDSPAGHGDSGGPLMNDQAELVGVTHAGMEGIHYSYFISVNQVKAFLKDKNLMPGRSPLKEEPSKKTLTRRTEKPETESEPPPKKKSAGGDSRESEAARKFDQAMDFIKDGKLEKGKARLEEVIRKFPGTKAADDAKFELEKLKR